MVAERVVEVPSQMICDPVIETVGITLLFTVRVTGTEMAEAGVAQLNEEVSLTRTCALPLRVLVVNVALVSPATSVPPTLH